MANDNKPRLDAERKWRYMIPVSHQFYIYGRKAAEEIMGPDAVDRFIRRFWELTGEDTARMYVELGKLQPEDLAGLVKSIARSSEIMGEDAEARAEGDRAYLLHHHCPWPENYRRFDLPETCQGGCDTWFQTIAARLSPRIRVKTTTAIPAGDDACVREFWIEE